MSPLVKTALALAAEWALEQLRKRRAQKAHAESPRASTRVTCGVCGARVPADAASMAAHTHEAR